MSTVEFLAAVATVFAFVGLFDHLSWRAWSRADRRNRLHNV
jgi:hypothetical protein